MEQRFLTIYKKNNGQLIYRSTKQKPPYCVGEETSMGWKVINIQRLYNGKVYTPDEYNIKMKINRKMAKILGIFSNIDIIKLVEIIFCFTFLKNML